MKDTGGCDSGFRYYDDSWKSCFSDKLFALVEYIAIFLSVARGPALASAVSLQRGELLIVNPKGRKDRREPERGGPPVHRSLPPAGPSWGMPKSPVPGFTPI